MENINEVKENIKTDIVNLKCILDLNKKYTVPIYQRPYDWDKNHIFELIRTLKDTRNTTIFLGNMEFRKQKKDNNNELEIIDGQQRITTLLLLLNYINNVEYNDKKLQEMFTIKMSKYGENSEAGKFVEFLKCKNTDEIEERFKNVKNKKSKENEVIRDFKIKNIYLLNYFYIKQLLEDAGIHKEDYAMFAKNILERVYVITVTLSYKMNSNQAIKIFDVINTTGKPLGTKDIFKVKMYDYSKQDEETFDNINYLYNQVDKKDEEIMKSEEDYIKEINLSKNKDVNIVSERFYINDILNMYKYILIARRKDEEYKNELYRTGVDTFYDLLFSCLLNNMDVKEFNAFKKEKEIIKYEDLKNIYNSYSEVSKLFLNVENNEWIKPDTYFSYKMLKGYYTRYSWTYYFLPAMYYWKFKNCKEEFQEFILLITKMFEIYSMLYSKVINHIKNFTNNIIIEKIVKAVENDKIDAKNINDEIRMKINDVLKKKDTNETDNKTDFEKMLEGKITDSLYKKEILCLRMAQNAEKKYNTDDKNLKKCYKKIFTKKFDIEHICARESQGNELNADERDRIENLMILEYSINRSIGNIPIQKKLEKYKTSDFGIVKKERQKMKTNDYKKYFSNRRTEAINEMKEYFL